MSRGWKHTDLRIGEDLLLPKDLFESGEDALPRILYSRYIGETETGIIIEVQYKPGVGSEAPLEDWRVTKFINFASIYCGDVVIKRLDHTTVRAYRKRELDMTVHNNGYHWKSGVV